MGGRFIKQPEIPRVDDLHGPVDDRYVVLPVLGRHNPPIQTLRLSRVAYQESEVEPRKFGEGPHQADCINTRTDLFRWDRSQVAGHSQLPGRARPDRVRH